MRDQNILVTRPGVEEKGQVVGFHSDTRAAHQYAQRVLADDAVELFDTGLGERAGEVRDYLWAKPEAADEAARLCPDGCSAGAEHRIAHSSAVVASGKAPRCGSSTWASVLGHRVRPILGPVWVGYELPRISSRR